MRLSDVLEAESRKTVADGQSDHTKGGNQRVRHREMEEIMSKKCAEFSTNEAGRKYCARFEDVGDIAMAEKKDEDNLGYFDIGEVTKAMGALGKIGMSDVIPPLVGGVGAVVTTLLIRKFMKDKADSFLYRWASVGGVFGGVLFSIPLYWVYGKQGVVKGALGGAVVGGSLLAFEKLEPMFLSGLRGLSIERRMRGMGRRVAAGGGARVLPSAKVPTGIASAMDVGAFAGGKNTYGMGFGA